MQQKYYELSNLAYAQFTPDAFEGEGLKQTLNYAQENIQTILSFIQQFEEQFQITDYQGKTVLETGCGLGLLGHYFAKRGAIVTSVDVSPLAIAHAKVLAETQGLDIEYFCQDLAQENVNLGLFDFVVDAHLLHCLADDAHRNQYLINVKNCLAPQGYFLIETMCYHPKISIPVGYCFDENNVVSKEWEDSIVAYRKIADSLTIEQELKQAELNIHYLYYHAELSFDIYPDLKNIPLVELPKTLRIATQRS